MTQKWQGELTTVTDAQNRYVNLFQQMSTLGQILSLRSTFQNKNVHIIHGATAPLCIDSRETLVSIHACSQMFTAYKGKKNKSKKTETTIEELLRQLGIIHNEKYYTEDFQDMSLHEEKVAK